MSLPFLKAAAKVASTTTVKTTSIPLTRSQRVWNRINTPLGAAVAGVSVGLGVCTGVSTAGEIRYNGLPRYTQLAKQDSTGTLTSIPAYAVATVATVSGVAVGTALTWPLVCGYKIGKSVRETSRYSA